MSETKRPLTRHQRRLMAAALAGTPPCEIAPRFRMTPAAVRNTLSSLRKKGYPIPCAERTARAPTRVIELARDTVAPLKAIAKRRGMTTRMVAAQVLAEAVRRNLVGEFLDARKRSRSQEAQQAA